MIENIYIAKSKIYLVTIPAIIVFLACIIFPIYFITISNFFYKVSLFKALGLTVYFLLMMKWAQELILYCKLALQKDPIIQVSNDGLLFNYNKKLSLIPWGHVLKIEKHPIVSSVGIFFTKEATIEFRTPFAKFGPNIMAAIAYTKSSAEENLNILMKHKDKFNKG